MARKPIKNHEFHKAVGAEIKRFRLKMDLSGCGMAREADIPKAAIFELEDGRRRLTFLDLIKICEVFELPLGEFAAHLAEVGSEFLEAEINKRG